VNKKIVFLLVLVSLIAGVHAQKIDKSFVLNGSINIDSGTILLMPVVDTLFYPPNLQTETVIKNGRFEFTGSSSSPHLFRLGLRINNRWKYISSIFFIDPIEQKIVCNVDSIREVPEITNKSMTELGHYNSFTRGKQNDSLLYDYVNENSNSYVGLWQLIMKLSSGYKPFYTTIFDRFSTSIRNSPLGLTLKNRLYVLSNVATGKTFPQLVLLDEKKRKQIVPGNISNNKYTFIDFWFSHCTPCIAQFDQLKQIYKRFNKDGFGMMAISVDGKKDEKEWRRVIAEYKLPWLQYWDVGSVESAKISVSEFPSNFLLDANGVIIARNIEPSYLESFLLAHCYK
jgi:thiol-disulfide isomerase/thioredoxin